MRCDRHLGGRHHIKTCILGPHLVVMIASNYLSEEVLAIDMSTALKSSLDYSHKLRLLRLYRDQA